MTCALTTPSQDVAIQCSLPAPRDTCSGTRQHGYHRASLGKSPLPTSGLSPSIPYPSRRRLGNYGVYGCKPVLPPLPGSVFPEGIISASPLHPPQHHLSE